MHFDMTLTGGTIIDGSGSRPAFPGDVGIVGDRIAAVGNLAKAETTHVVDVSGYVVSPGFIDNHVHSEIALLGGRDQFAGVQQGITTQFLSPDGFGWAPLPVDRARELWWYTKFGYGDVEIGLDYATVNDYLALFPSRIPANVCPQAPHCAIRLGAMGWKTEPANDDELATMVRTTREWLEAGAAGLCLGLDYQPSANSDRRELLKLAELVASYGGVWAAHIRYQMLGRRGAWTEAIEIAQDSGAAVHVSHERLDDEAVPVVEQAEQEGIDITFDSYLYSAGMTHVAMLLPMDVQAGNVEAMLEQMADPKVRKRCLPYLRKKIGTQANQLIAYTRSGRFVGMTLAEAAAEAGKSWETFAYDLVLEEQGIETFSSPWQVTPQKAEEIIARTAVHPRMMIASDGIYNIPRPHPRSYGCFARVLRRFVRELELLSLETAVYKMSGFPARRFGLTDRGQIAQGMAADIVVFDATSIADHSTWQNPVQAASGIQWVLVNGQPVIGNGLPTGQLPGRVLHCHD